MNVLYMADKTNGTSHHEIKTTSPPITLCNDLVRKNLAAKKLRLT